MKLSNFAKYCWAALAYNVIVILWGVFLRASKSGDGCGRYWLTCHGEIIPSAPQLKTVIEFSHRIMSGIDLVVVLILLIWAFKKFDKPNQIRIFAAVSFIFIITEALIGAGLVLTGNTAETLTRARPFWAIGHLVNTFILLGSLTLTAWVASTGTRLKVGARKRALKLIGAAVIAIFLVGSSGSLAALSSTLFPSQSVIEGFIQDFSTTSHFLVRLRISHPILSILSAVYLIFLAGWLKRNDPGNVWVRKFAKYVIGLVLAQLVFGTLTLLTLAPIIMQLGHLLLADLVWMTLILLSAAFFSENRSSGKL